MQADGALKGPLHGVPITVKDSLDTEGIISTGGTMGRKSHIPDKDAPTVARLRESGAVLIGKTNTPELTLSGETCNLIYGRTCNPYNIELSPGGSSGGSAAIIAAGGSALELGSDTGGSIREPAHLCGIAGLKPTCGRVPRSGHILPWGSGALDSLTQVGPMARHVEDLALCLPIISGMDGEDPGVVPMPHGNPEDVDLVGLRIALYDDDGITEPATDIKRVVNQAGDSLSDLGLKVDRILPPAIPEAVELYVQLRLAIHGGVTMRLLEKYGTAEPGPHIKYVLGEGLEQANSVDNTLLESIDRVKSEMLQFMQNYDVIICPPSHTIARAHDASLEDSIYDWSNIIVQNLFGVPGVVVRAGTSESGNLPVGIQVTAAHWREDIALAVASKIEALHGGYIPPEL
jgi:amidase